MSKSLFLLCLSKDLFCKFLRPLTLSIFCWEIFCWEIFHLKIFCPGSKRSVIGKRFRDYRTEPDPRNIVSRNILLRLLFSSEIIFWEIFCWEIFRSQLFWPLVWLERDSEITAQQPCSDRHLWRGNGRARWAPVVIERMAHRSTQRSLKLGQIGLYQTGSTKGSFKLGQSPKGTVFPQVNHLCSHETAMCVVCHRWIVWGTQWGCKKQISSPISQYFSDFRWWFQLVFSASRGLF